MRLALLILPMLALSACAYSLPDSLHSRPYSDNAAGEAPPPASKSRDLDTCRRAADREMGSDAAIDPADDHTANPMVLARREQLRSTYQTLVDQCMGTNPH